MAKAVKKAGETPDRRGGGYFLFPDCLLGSAAWRAMSPLAVKLLMVLCSRHNGFNNGRITLSQREAADALGSRNFHAISAAFAELEGLGVAVLSVDHARIQRMAREYRLTFVNVGDRPATNEYLSWQPGDAGTRKKRAAPTAAETCLSAEATAAEAKLSAETCSADEAKSAKISLVSAEHGSTHICNHLRVAGLSHSDLVKNAGGPFRAIREAASGHETAAPSADELRGRALSFVCEHGRGSQGRLAKLAEIPPGTFSKFLHQGGPLGHGARVLLACRLPAAETAERKLHPVAA